MKEPLMIDKLLRDWTAMPKVLDNCIARGDAAREARPGFVPLMGLSAMSDVEPPQAYAHPGCAQVYNRAIRQFRRRAAFSAFVSGISRSALETRLETYALLYAGIMEKSHPDWGTNHKINKSN
jgi:hypothetical protein